jgi:two-component system, sensor histidine kinase LadS
MKKPLLSIILFLCIFNTKSQDRISYFRDSAKKFQAQTVINAPFVALKKNQFGLGEDSSYHWLKINISNQAGQKVKKYVEINSPWLDSVWVYTQTLEPKIKLSWKTPFSERVFPNQNFILPIDVNPKTDTIIYARFYRKLMVIIGGASVQSEASFFENKMQEESLYGIFIGVIFFVSTFAFFMYFSNKEKLYLFYGIYALFNLFFVLTLYANYLKFYQQGFFYIPGFQINEAFSWVVHLSIFFFIRSFLIGETPLNKPLKWIWNTTLVLMAAIIPLKIQFFHLLATNEPIPKYLLLAPSLCFLWTVLSSFVLLFYTFYKKINLLAAYTYSIGILPLGIFSIFTYLRNLQIVPHRWWLEYEIQIVCVLWDVLVLMIGLGIRYRMIRKEKEIQQHLAFENKFKLYEEKERISRDLHDNVGSQLSVISSNLDNFSYLSEKQILTIDKIEMVNEFVREATQSLRDTIWATHQEKISMPEFRARIQEYVLKYYQSFETCHITVNFEETPTNLSSSQALNLFRIIQEALNNALKYAQASHISVKFKIIEQHFTFTIIDNGIGFDIENKKNGLHCGLLNMEKRVNEMEGKLCVQSKNGIGTKIEVVLPIRHLSY